MADGNGNGYELTQGEYAKRRGISQPMVAKLIRQGKLDGAYVKRGRLYKINAEKADAILSAFDPSSATAPAAAAEVLGPAPGADPGRPAGVPLALVSFAEAARREKIIRTRLLELRFKRERGELVERERVEEVAAHLATLVRVGIEAIPAKVAPTVAGMATPGEVARYLATEFKAVLNNLSKGIASLDL